MYEKMRYVTVRSTKGRDRYYWQRRGHKLTRLPDDPVDRFALVAKLNGAADTGRTVEADRGSIRWVIDQYRASDAFKSLAHGTLKYYVRYLREIEALGPDLPFGVFTRAGVIDFVETYPKPHQRRQCAAVLKNLFNTARYYGIVDRSEADGLRLKGSPPRDRLWSADEIGAWMIAAGAGHMLTAFMLLRYTAQRPSDVLAMTRAHYNGDTILVRQKKTDKLLAVPCHPDLKAHLDSQPKTMMLVFYKGQRVKYGRFNHRFRIISQVAGSDAQARDLRRTAMVNMALAGATVPQISSVSGHSIEETQRIIDTYIPKNVALAREAIAMLPGGNVPRTKV